MAIEKQELLAILKQNNIDVAVACEKTHMSRTNFYYHINKPIISEDFILKIEKACNIKILTGVK
ncbi:MAG: hypothetical protein JWQ66_2937 [Mucilaginibacter sp.]|nr:hypothetical protein [Mucilaginibacter sp.]